MARVVRWQVPFMSLDNKAYRVDIYQENYSGQVEVLKGAANPFFTQEDDDEDAFSPIRTSSGYLTVIVENMQLIDDILPNDDHDRYVELVNVTNSLQPKRVWNGFIAPDLYSGTWDRVPFELQLPLLSPLAAARGTRFVPTERARMCYWLIKDIFRDVEVAPTYLWFAKLDYGNPAMVPFLSAILSDSIFLPEDKEDDLKPCYGSEPLPPLKSECFTVVDVLEALCRAYGYVLYETPDNYYFASADKTNTYRRVEYAHVDSSGYDVITFNGTQFPTVVSSGHSRSLLPGKSLVRVYCNLEEFDNLMPIDLRGCDVRYPSYMLPIHGVGENGEVCVEYLRYDPDYYNSKQYVNNPPAGVALDNPVNVQWENYDADGRAYVGGNWISYGMFSTVSIYPGGASGFPDEEALIVTTTESGYTDHLYAGGIKSKRKYSAINMPDGLTIDFTAEFNKDFGDYRFEAELGDDNITIYYVLKWGDYYYQQDADGRLVEPYWATTFHVCSMHLGSTDHKVYHPYYRDGLGHHVHISPSLINDLQGKIRLIFYTFPETQGVNMMRIKDLKVSLHQEQVRDPVPTDIDYGMLDYRQSLSVFRLSEYAYKQKLSTRGIDHSISGIQVDDPQTDTSYEELLLSRLAQWYDRTIEQLSVTVENEDIQPGVRIVRGNAKYIVLSRTVDWRNGQRILTLQRMYDEQPQSET